MSTDVGTTPRRRLTTRDKLQVWEREKGRCQECKAKIQTGERFTFEHMRALELGGSNDLENIRLTCWRCEPEKTKDDHRRAGKAKRQKAQSLGLKTSRRPMPCGRKSPWKRTMDGKTVRRT